MTGHEHAASHMQDFEAHVKAVEEDLEYYRAKRFEPIVFFQHRRGVVSLYDLLRAAPTVPTAADRLREGGAAAGLEQRIRAVEDSLDEYVRGIARVVGTLSPEMMVIEDIRAERGDYDDRFRITKRPHGGSLEERIERLEVALANYRVLLDAYSRALVETGLTTDERLAAQATAPRVGGKGWNGARIVARAWVDPAFKRDLIERGREAVRVLDIPPGKLGKLGVAENTETLHNVVVCTLCSCYPHDLLGDTPWWYKHDSYKQRIVSDPRGALAEMFDLHIPEGVTIRVHDSTSDIRWMVLPRRPAGTDGMTEEQLAELVTQESLIGVAEPLRPAQLAGAAAGETGR
jgi:nitrile hydratase